MIAVKGAPWKAPLLSATIHRPPIERTRSVLSIFMGSTSGPMLASTVTVHSPTSR
jgi:hypothetical protein